MRKHRGTSSRQDKHVTLAAISPPGDAQGRFVRGQQSGLAGCKSPPLCRCGASSGRHSGTASGNHGAPLHDRVHLPTYLPTYLYYEDHIVVPEARLNGRLQRAHLSSGHRVQPVC